MFGFRDDRAPNPSRFSRDNISSITKPIWLPLSPPGREIIAPQLVPYRPTTASLTAGR